MVTTSTGSQEILWVALGDPTGHPELNASQPNAPGTGVFLGIILLRQMLKVWIWHRKEPTGWGLLTSRSPTF